MLTPFLMWFWPASSLICGNKMPTRCNRGFYCRSYCLNVKQAIRSAIKTSADSIVYCSIWSWLLSAWNKHVYLFTYLFTYSLTQSVTHSLTPWSRVLLEELTSFQLDKKFPTFYGTRRFITAFTSAHHLSLSWASLIQSIPPCPTS